MYDIGKRIDGQFNVWKMTPADSKFIIRVFKDEAEAVAYIKKKERR